MFDVITYPIIKLYTFIYGIILIIITGVGSSLGTIEPNTAVWIISLGGALLTSTLGVDKKFTTIIFHLLMGLGWGIFGSQIIHNEYTVFPQPAIAFFSSIFGVQITWFFIRNLKEADLDKTIMYVVDEIFSKFSLKKK